MLNSRLDFARSLGEDVGGYLINKTEGAKSFEKGHSFEGQFLTLKLAEAILNLLDKNLRQDISCPETYAFIDDIQIESNVGRENYQLKNSNNFSWGKEENIKSIVSDFNHQYLLNTKEGIQNSNMYLICSDEAKVENLKKSLPQKISTFTRVEYFPFLPINRLLVEHKEFNDVIGKISALQDSDKLEAVAVSILGLWSSRDYKKVSSDQFYKDLKDLYPNYVKVLDREFRMAEDVEQILSNIPDFTFKMVNGHLNWEYSGSDSGCLPYDCHSPKFEEFQESIRAIMPTSFDCLEGVLS